MMIYHCRTLAFRHAEQVPLTGMAFLRFTPHVDARVMEQSVCDLDVLCM